LILKIVITLCNNLIPQVTKQEKINTIMKLDNALHIFTDLKNQSIKKSEVKVYKQFVSVLTSLSIRKLTAVELKFIEVELDDLELNTNETKKLRFYKKGLIEFEKFLKEKLTLVPNLHYTKLYGGLGMSFGILFGVIALSSFDRSLGLALGMIIGMVIGSIMGRSKDAESKKEGRVL